MWRNFGWTAILATWTIFLILNSSLAGERTFDNPRIDNRHASHETHQRATFPAFDRKAIDDSTLWYAKEIVKTNDQRSLRTNAISRKTVEIQDFSNSKKHIAISDAIATSKYTKGKNDRNAWLTATGIPTRNMWSPKIIVLERSRNTRYPRFASSLRVSPRMSQRLKSASRKRKRKEEMTYVFLSDRKKAAEIRRDVRALDEENEWWKRLENKRLFIKGIKTIASLLDAFKRYPYSKRDSFMQKFKNSDSLKFNTLEKIESKHIDEKREQRNKNERDSRRSFESTKNSANKLIYVEDNDEPQTLGATFPNYSSSKENQSRENVGDVMDVTGDAITGNSPHKCSMTATLIFDSKISNTNEKIRENARNPYLFPCEKRTKSYKTDESRASGAYKWQEEKRSKMGFKAKADEHEDRKENANIEDAAFTFSALKPSDNYLTKSEISFTERALLWKEENALRMARDIPDSRREYHSSTYNVGTRKNEEKTMNLSESKRGRETEKRRITIDANYVIHKIFKTERDPLLTTNLPIKEIDKTKPALSTLARISVTQQRNPMHVRYVKSGTDCQHQRTADIETEVRATAGIDLWNVRGSSKIAKSANPSEQEVRNRSKYSRNVRSIHNTETIDDRSKFAREPQASSKSISFDGTTILDNNLTKVWRSNGYTLSSSKLTDESELTNVRIATNQGENYDETRKESDFRSRSIGVRNSKYRRYKRHEVRSTSGSSILTEFDSETGKTLDRVTAATSNSSIKLIANPSTSSIHTSDVGRISANAEEFLTTVATPSSTKYQEFQKEWRSITPMDTDYERYVSTLSKIGSDSLEIPLIDAPKTSNISPAKMPTLPIEKLDQSTAATKIDNSIIPKEAPSSAEGIASEVTNKNVTHAPSIEPFNSQEGTFTNGSVSIIDLLPQRNSDPSRDVSENITTENVDDSSSVNATLIDQWPVKHSAVVEGDLVLGGLMMVHEREDTITCGPVMPQGGVQALEAMLYTLDTLNDREIVPGVKIGAHILDDCDKDTYGLEMAVDFIKETKRDYGVFLEENFRYVAAIDESTLTIRAYNIFREISSGEITLAKPPRHNFWWDEIVLTYFVIALVQRNDRIYMHEMENIYTYTSEPTLLLLFKVHI